MPRVPKTTAPYPDIDEPTDEVNPYERLMRRYAHAAEPELSIEEEMEREGIEDRDPFAEFVEVGAAELAEPTTEDPAALSDELADLSADALEPVDADALEPLGPDAADPVVGRPRRS